MRRNTRTFLIWLYAALNLFLCGTASGQDEGNIPSGWSTAGPITIEASIDSAVVIIDSVRTGITPLTIGSLTPGLHHISLVHPDVENWLTGNIRDSFVVNAGETRTLRYVFTPWYIISSNPFGADVVIGDSFAGSTPFVLKTMGPLGGSGISIRKAGYEATDLSLADANRGAVGVSLKKIWRDREENQSLLTDSDETDSDHLRLYITGAATILSGAAAAFFKVQADERYDLYLKTGDPGLLQKTNRLDTASAIALGATQVGLALCAYFLLSE
jgi:hypothetical protein